MAGTVWSYIVIFLVWAIIRETSCLKGVSMKSNMSVLKKLFSSTFALSSFTFGGGYVIVPLMKEKFVDDLAWLEEEEMLDMIAIAQSAPGPIVVNTSIILGYKIAGLAGAIVTLTGTVLPPLIIMTIVSMFYSAFRDNPVVSAILKGMQAGVAAVIANVVVDMGAKVLDEKSWISTAIMVGAFIANFVFKVNIMLIILVCALIGLGRYFFLKDK